MENSKNFETSIHMDGIDDDLAKAFSSNVDNMEISPLIIKVFLKEDFMLNGRKLITLLQEKSLTKPYMSQLTGKMMPPVGNVTINNKVYLDRENGRSFEDKFEGLFLADVKYTVGNSDSNDIVYEMTFAEPQALAMKSIMG